jgi:hypothetical protein
LLHSQRHVLKSLYIWETCYTPSDMFWSHSTFERLVTLPAACSEVTLNLRDFLHSQRHVLKSLYIWETCYTPSGMFWSHSTFERQSRRIGIQIAIADCVMGPQHTSMHVAVDVGGFWHDLAPPVQHRLWCPAANTWTSPFQRSYFMFRSVETVLLSLTKMFTAP